MTAQPAPLNLPTREEGGVMGADTEGRPDPIPRIPLTITATATGQTTDGVLVAVLASDLDRLEAKQASDGQ